MDIFPDALDNGRMQGHRQNIHDFGTTLFLSNNSNMIYMLVAVCILFFKDMRDEFFHAGFSSSKTET